MSEPSKAESPSPAPAQGGAPSATPPTPTTPTPPSQPAAPEAAAGAAPKAVDTASASPSTAPSAVDDSASAHDTEHYEAVVSTPMDRRDARQLRSGRLGALAIAFFVISAAAPLTGMAGGAPFAMLLGDGVGVPFAYLVVTILMLIFAVGYVTMARFHTSTGAFYSYVSRALGGYAGGAAAWLALLGYNAMQVGLYGLFGYAAAGVVGLFGVPVAWWVMALLGWASIAVLGYRQIDLSVKVLGLLVGAEFLIVLAFDVMVIVRGGAGATGQALSTSSFTVDALMSGAPAIGLLFAAASFVGFEATTIYSEEAKEPRRTVPRATYLAVATIGLLFVLTSWLMVNAYGNDAGLVDYLGSAELGEPTNFLFVMAAPYLGAFVATKVMVFLFATSIYAALLAFHNAVARYLYALGREGLVPEEFGKTHPKHQSPHTGSLAQSVLALTIILIFAIARLDPTSTLFTWLTQLGTLAIMMLMATAALSVVVFFARNRGLESNAWKTTLAPIVAAVGLAAVAAYAWSQFSFLVGSTGALTVGLLSTIPVALVIGLLSAARLKRREPAAFAAMGRHRGPEIPGRTDEAPVILIPATPPQAATSTPPTPATAPTATATATGASVTPPTPATPPTPGTGEPRPASPTIPPLPLPSPSVPTQAKEAEPAAPAAAAAPAAKSGDEPATKDAAKPADADKPSIKAGPRKPSSPAARIAASSPAASKSPAARATGGPSAAAKKTVAAKKAASTEATKSTPTKGTPAKATPAKGAPAKPTAAAAAAREGQPAAAAKATAAAGQQAASDTPPDSGTQAATPKATPAAHPGGAPAEAKKKAAPAAKKAAKTSAPTPAGAVRANADGTSPDPAYVVKGNADSGLFHEPTGRWYKATVAEFWFKDAADAEAAGYRRAGSRKKKAKPS